MCVRASVSATVCVSVCVCVCEKVTVEIQIHEHSVIVSLCDFFPALFVCCVNIVGLIYEAPRRI